MTDFSKPEMLVFDTKGESLPGSIRAGMENPLLLTSNRALVLLTADPFLEPEQGCRLVIRHPSGEDRPFLQFSSRDHEDDIHAEHKGARGTMRFNWQNRVLSAVTPDRQTLFIGSTRNLEFAVYRSSDLKKVDTIHQEKVIRPPLTQAEVNAYPVYVGLMGKRFRAKDFEQPDFKPPVADIMADNQARLWVRLSRAWERKESTYLVWQRNGEFLGSLSLPATEKLFAAGEHFIWTYDRNQDED